MVGVFVLLMIGGSLMVFLMFRNDRVHDYRQKLLGTISNCVEIDIQENRSWEWRYEIYHSVSYDNMLYRFWKPLESFYKDKSFLE